MFDFVYFLHREETSRPATALAANPSMAPSLQMRTSPSSTADLEFCPWPTLDPTRMDLNSSFARWRLSGWMASMWCLALWLTAWMLWRRLRLLALSLARPPSRWSLRTAAASRQRKAVLRKWIAFLSIYLVCWQTNLDVQGPQKDMHRWCSYFCTWLRQHSMCCACMWC